MSQLPKYEHIPNNLEEVLREMETQKKGRFLGFQLIDAANGVVAIHLPNGRYEYHGFELINHVAFSRRIVRYRGEERYY